MTSIYLFGDQTIHADEALHTLLHIKNNPILRCFLDEAFSAIQQEISYLPASERSSLPNTHTLALLLDGIKKERRHVALESTMVCLCEIGEYIRLLDTTDLCHPPTNSLLVGFCTGSLAAAAVACSRTTADLQTLGVEAVVVAFRVGMHVARRANTLVAENPTHLESWTVIVADKSESRVEELLQIFIKEKDLPVLMRPYISAVGTNTVTISGSPKVLQELSDSSHFADRKAFPVPIYAPYHAGHIFREADVDSILQFRSMTNFVQQQRLKTPLISCATGRFLEETVFSDILRALVTEILTCQIRFDKVDDSIVRQIERTPARLIPLHTHIASRLTTSLSEIGVDVKCFTSRRPEDHFAETQRQPPSDDASKIAITGFSGRFPEADGLAEFWALLQQGLDVHKPIPADRFDREAHYDATLGRKNTSRIRHGCWIRNPGLFDARFFQMSPREAHQSDPAQRLALLTAYEAMEMAGFVPDRTPSGRRDRVGVYYGMTSDDWREVNSSQDIDTYYIPGGIRAFVPGRLNYFFKFSGPSVSVDTACSSSLAAINVACTALLNRDCDTALAGGTNILTNPDNFAGLDRGHFLSSTGNCKTFDDDADGYCRADGVGTVILKRLSDAIADNDPIFGVVVGAQTSHSAEAVSITRPLADAQASLFRQLLTASGIHPHDISYIEMHGTGTQAGDAVEMKSVLQSFAWDNRRGPDKPLHLGSVKANVGHGESASGVTALIKVLLMMQKSRIPPHCGIKGKINSRFPTDLTQRNVHIALTETEWIRPVGGKRRSFVNNFSAAGGNTALLLEDAPSSNIEHSADPRRYHTVAVSARSLKALSRNMEALAEFIGSDTSPDLLARIAYTTTARRMHHSYRAAVTGNTLQGVKRQLLDTAASPDVEPCPTKCPDLGFLFTGQGAQQTAIARELYENFTSFHDDIANFDAVGRGYGFSSILPLITGTVDIAELSPIIIQLGTVVIQIAMARLWQNWGVIPGYVLGHSLGEYAALHLAGVLSISDTIYLAGSRAALLEKRCTAGSHGMLAVKASLAELEGVLKDVRVEVACINGRDDTVLSGSNDEIDRTSTKLSEQRVIFKKLTLPFAFHSSQVDPILEELEHIASQVTFHAPRIPIVSPLLGRIITEEGVIRAGYVRRHCREPVDFLGALQAARHAGIIGSGALAVEIGGHPILARLLKDVTVCPTLSQRDDTFKTLANSLSVLHCAGVPLNWSEYHRDFRGSHQVVTLPGYSWDYQNYWIQYENNFCLTKGCPVQSGKGQGVPLASTRLSPSVQRIVEEHVNGTQVIVVIESDLNDPELLPVALEHKVNGLILCPSSLYADIAQTLGDYLLKGKQDFRGHQIDVCNMTVNKALIVTGAESQLLRASLDMDWDKARGIMKVYSVDNSGQSTTEHAQCVVELHRTKDWHDNWDRQLYLIQRSIAQLTKGIEECSTHKMHRGLVYKLFSSVMEYGRSYQGIEDVIFDSAGLEATARVRLPSTKGQYALNPFWLDSFGHLTGFVMNCNDSLDLTEHLYVNHGWGFMRCAERFSPDTIYQTHVKMQPTSGSNSLYTGDVYVLRDNRIIAQFGAVTFQRVSRRVLGMLLPATISKGSTSALKHKSVDAARPGPMLEDTEPGKRQPVANLWQEVLGVIAREVGLQSSQLTEEVHFADMGVDSLMSLTILGILRETLSLDLPSHLFEECPSVQSLRDYLEIPSLSDPSSNGTSWYPTPSESVMTASTTPIAKHTSSSRGSAVDVTNTTVQLVLSLLAEEMGLTPQELSKEDDLTELGLDSLLALTTLGRAREMDLDLPQGFFLQYTSVSSITAALRAILGSPKDDVLLTPVTIHPPATSVLLQGNDSCSQLLFLFPDGSGSSTSYAMIPTISEDVCVYAMDCPYLKRPKEMKCALQDLTPQYVSEIRRRQPHGPYNLAGWSAGGIAAYDAAQCLVEQGETVERLILIDSPNPMNLEKCPPQFYRFLEQAGVFGSHSGQKPPAWLLQHFQVFNDVLEQYNPVPFCPTRAAPAATLIWAQDGVCKSATNPRPEYSPGDPEVIPWLLDSREDLRYNGWDVLLEESNIHIERIAGANHFTVVRIPAATRLAEILRKIMSE